MKQLTKVLGGVFFMGVGAFAMGSVYVFLYENLTGQSISNSEVKK